MAAIAQIVSQKMITFRWHQIYKTTANTFPLFRIIQTFEINKLKMLKNFKTLTKITVNKRRWGLCLGQAVVKYNHLSF